MITVIIIVGVLAIGAVGVSARRQRTMNSWLVAGRKNRVWTSWFLNAGESLTTFSFLGLAGIGFAGGVAASYAVGYLTAAAIGMFFVAPRVRDLAASRGYLTMSDFLQDRFRSRTLGVFVAVAGALFLIPYLQLQLEGLGQIVRLATGDPKLSGISMVLASILVVVFVIWAGIRGIARTAMVKDALMLIGLVVVVIGVVIAAGGFGHLFHRVADADAQLLTLHPGSFDAVWWVSSIGITVIGTCFNTFPHLWPPVFAARSGAILRSNFKWLAVYQLLLFLPITVGMAAVFLIPSSTAPNEVLFTAALKTMPQWLVAVVAVAGAAAAMVPAGALAMGSASLLSNNVLFRLSDRARFVWMRVLIVVVVAAALLFGFVQDDIGALLLLTYGGTAQMAPAVALALPRRVKVSARAIVSGLVVGTLVVAVITFGNIPHGTLDTGVIGLAVNVVVLAAVEAVMRQRRRTVLSTPVAESVAG